MLLKKTGICMPLEKGDLDRDTAFCSISSTIGATSTRILDVGKDIQPAAVMSSPIRSGLAIRCIIPRPLLIFFLGSPFHF